MLELESLYFVITSRSWKFCRMLYLDYHGFEATTQLSTGRNGTPTSNMVRIHTGCFLANEDIPPSYSSKPFEAGPSFDTSIQSLESESGWESYPTCQGTPQPTLVDTCSARY